MNLFSKSVRFSIVVPVFNSEKSLNELFLRLEKAMQSVMGSYELIFVDDGSRDSSWKVMKELSAHDSRVKAIRFSRNFGQHKALICGFRHCQGEYVITLDDDLQNPPEEIPKLIDAIEKDAELDVVSGRSIEKPALLRNLAGFLYHLFRQSLFNDLRTRISRFKIMRRAVVEEILKNRSKNLLIDHALLETTDRFANVDLHHAPRHQGRSGYTLTKLLALSWDTVINRSDLPLKLVSFTGFASALASLGVLIFYLHRYLVGGIGVPGWITLVVLGSFFPGMILLSFGIVGQYLIRIMREVNDTPQYVVRETKGLG